jgi:hypothetical protein
VRRLVLGREAWRMNESGQVWKWGGEGERRERHSLLEALLQARDSCRVVDDPDEAEDHHLDIHRDNGTTARIVKAEADKVDNND